MNGEVDAVRDLLVTRRDQADGEVHLTTTEAEHIIGLLNRLVVRISVLRNEVERLQLR